MNSTTFLEHRQLFYPILALIILKFVVLIRLASLRVTSVLTRKIKIGYFRGFGEVADIPAAMTYASRNFINLFEMPVLFYIVLIFTLLFNQVDEQTISFAWCFVAFRYIHSLIHITYNNVNHRFMAFVGSNIFLIVLIIRLTLALSKVA
ncbi:MAG: MAPEG family protein [Bacteriovoracaceae bacterium]